MLKSLSDKLAQVEPFHNFWDSKYHVVDRASYEQMKAIAIELAKACEGVYNNCACPTPEDCFDFADDAITKCTEMLERTDDDQTR